MSREQGQGAEFLRQSVQVQHTMGFVAKVFLGEEHLGSLRRGASMKTKNLVKQISKTTNNQKKKLNICFFLVCFALNQ